jgi:hypothetical protein
MLWLYLWEFGHTKRIAHQPCPIEDGDVLSFNIHKIILPIGVIPAATMVALIWSAGICLQRSKKQKAI